jgi:hypothetical protein
MIGRGDRDGWKMEMARKIQMTMEMEMGVSWKERETEIAEGRRR